LNSFFFSPSFPGSSSSSYPFKFLSEDLFWASYPPPFSRGDPANLSFAPLSILLWPNFVANCNKKCKGSDNFVRF
jgi:hypothetical protein